MTKTISLNENVSIQTVIALTRNGDEGLIEENGELLDEFWNFDKKS